MLTWAGFLYNCLIQRVLRETDDVIEQIGVEKSRSALSQADLILLVLNYNEPLNEEEKQIIGEVQSRQAIVIVNKTDLPPRLEMEEVYAAFSEDRVVKMSVLNGEGIERLEEVITNLFFSGGHSVARFVLCKQCETYRGARACESIFARSARSGSQRDSDRYDPDRCAAGVGTFRGNYWRKRQ